MTKKEDEKGTRLSIIDDEDQELVKLGPNDVAIVIRDNLDMELLIPKRDDEEEVRDAEMHAFAVMMALGDEEMSQKIMDLAEAKMDEVSRQDEIEEIQLELLSDKKNKLN